MEAASVVPEGFEPEDQSSVVPSGFEPEEPSRSSQSLDSVVPPGFEPEEKIPGVPEGFEPEEKPDYSTPGQQALTVGENFAKGFAPGLATAAELKLSKMGVPGLSAAEQTARAQQNPWKARGSEFAGNMALMAALPEAEFVKLGQVGAKAINSMIQMGTIAGGDELSDYLLTGKGNSGPMIAGHIIGAGALGLVGGGISGKAAEEISKYAEKKLGNQISNYMAGMGNAATEGAPLTEESVINKMGGIPENFNPKMFKRGQDEYFKQISRAQTGLPYVVGIAGSKLGPTLGIGGAVGSALGLWAGNKLAGKIPQFSQKIIAPMLTKLVSSGNFQGAMDLIDHGVTTSRGLQAMGKGVDALFKAGGTEYLNYETDPKEREDLDEFVSNGGTDNQLTQEQQRAMQMHAHPFAEGGEVPDQVTPMPQLSQPDPIATHYPDQNIALTATKGRLSNYLNSLRPTPNPMKLPYDKTPDDTHQKKEYHRALDIANQPLSVLKKIKQGDLLPRDVQHLTQMYPEVHQELSNLITKRLAKSQMDEEKRPPYKVRQAMSLFLGSNLESSLSQPNMMAAQQVFMKQNMQKQAMSMSAAKGNGLNKLSKLSTTPGQGAQQRLNKD